MKKRLEEKVVSLEIARLAEKLGFDNLLCYQAYSITGIMDLPFKATYQDLKESGDLENGLIPTPTKNLLKDWIRETFHIDITLISAYDGNPDHWSIKIEDFTAENPDKIMNGKLLWESEYDIHYFYEEALNIGIEKAIKIINHE